jgi:hypothetical protein
VWGVWLDDGVWICIGRTSVKARNIDRNPSVAIHLESGDRVVILEGTVAERSEGLEPFLDAYGAKYEYRPDLVALDAVVYALFPETVLTWVERDYQRTAVRWVFS